MSDITVIRRPLLFYNSNGSKMIVAFPQVQNQFEMYLHKHSGYHRYSQRMRNKLYKATKKERVYSPFVNTPGGTTRSKWWSAKFIVTKAGKFMTRMNPRQYTNAVKQDINGNTLPMFAHTGKYTRGILNRRCKF